MNDGLFEVTLITNPKNPLELQEIMTALLTAEDNTDLIYSFKSAHVVIESEEAVPWSAGWRIRWRSDPCGDR